MAHILVAGLAVLEARPNIASRGPALVGAALSGSVEEYLSWGEDRQGVRDRRKDREPPPPSLKTSIVISETFSSVIHPYTLTSIGFILVIKCQHCKSIITTAQDNCKYIYIHLAFPYA